LPEYFFTCLNMTNLIGKYHVINYLNKIIELAVLECKAACISKKIKKVFIRNFNIN